MNLESSILNMYEELVLRITSGNGNLNYLNLGYWENTLLVEEACKELINQFSNFAEIASKSHVLDVGIGYGEQIKYLLEKYPSLTVYGIDLLKGHIKLAQKNIASSKHSERAKIEVGNAINLSRLNTQFDQIISIESAFHFNTREQFFKAAFSALKPGGKLALADVIISKERINLEIAERIGIPLANAYDIIRYKELLKNAGFKNIKVKDVSNHVLPFCSAEAQQKGGWRSKKTLHLTKGSNKKLITNFLNSTAIESYYFITAIK